MITEAQRKGAMDWLNRTGPYSGWAPFTHDSSEHRGVLLVLLAEPRMPEEPSEAMLLAMDRSSNDGRQYARTISLGMYAALRAELLKDAKAADPPLQGTSEPLDLKARLDRIEARQFILYEKLHGALNSQTEKQFLLAEWNAAARP